MWDKFVTFTTGFAKVFVAVGTIYTGVSGYVNRNIILDKAANVMASKLLPILRDDVKKMLPETLKQETVVMKLSDDQMEIVRGWIFDSKDEMLTAFPLMFKRSSKIELDSFMSQTYPIYDFYTGDLLEYVTGIKTDDGWIFLRKEVKK